MSSMLSIVVLSTLISTISGLHVPGFVNGKPLRHHLEDVLYPEIAATDCSHVQEFNFTANVDNFDIGNTDTWNQRYQLNDQFFNSDRGEPVIFLNIGGEGEIAAKWVCWQNYTYMLLAQKYNALVIQLEHRFFGYSYPYFTKDGLADMSTATLSLLTSQQALADAAYFIKNFKYQNYDLSKAKWIAVGGSYPGSLCAYFRALYPDLTVGGICSSAPLWPKVDFYEYAEVMEFALTDWNKTCAANVKKGFNEAKQMTFTDDGRTKLNTIFAITPKLDPKVSTDYSLDATNFLASLFGSFQGVVQYTFDGANNNTINGYDINTLCSKMTRTLKKDESYIDLIKDVFFWTMETGGDNSHTTPNNYTDMLAPFVRNTYNVQNADDRGVSAMRGWMWLSCGMAFGWLQTSDNYGMFGDVIPLGYYIKQCEDFFGPPLTTDGIRNRTLATASYFGTAQTFTATNVLLPNGGYDPWHALGSYVYDSNRHQVPVFTPGAAHCSDMYPHRVGEPAGLPQTREIIGNEVDYYITGKLPPTQPPMPTPVATDATITTNNKDAQNQPSTSQKPDDATTSNASLYSFSGLLIAFIGIVYYM